MSIFTIDDLLEILGGAEKWKELISQRNAREAKNTALEKEWALHQAERFYQEEDAWAERNFQRKKFIEWGEK